MALKRWISIALFVSLTTVNSNPSTSKLNYFDVLSCETMIPYLRTPPGKHSQQSSRVTKGAWGSSSSNSHDGGHHHHHHGHHDGHNGGDHANNNGEESSENSQEEYDYDLTDQQEDDNLRPSEKQSPYRISPSTPMYRRDRVMTVKIDGPELNGFFLQVRQINSPSLVPNLIGSFKSNHPSAKTLTCGNGNMPDNTITNSDNNKKKSLEFKWKAPSEDLGSIQFVATIVKGDEYWSNVLSVPLILNEFPPSLVGCGSTKSCFRYSTSGMGCEADNCQYLVITTIEHRDVIITIGGNVNSNKGYVGIGFTSDKEKASQMELCACMKKGARLVDAAHYVVENFNEEPIKHHEEMEDEELDIDGTHIWCQFRRPLKIPGVQAVDLGEPQNLVFLWGQLHDITGDPVLPNVSNLPHIMEPWNHSIAVDVTHLVGSATMACSRSTIIYTSSMLTILLWMHLL